MAHVMSDIITELRRIANGGRPFVFVGVILRPALRTGGAPYADFSVGELEQVPSAVEGGH